MPKYCFIASTVAGVIEVPYVSRRSKVVLVKAEIASAL